MQNRAATSADFETPVERRRGTIGKVLKYGAGSVVATICSEVAFLAVYGLADASTTWASLIGWFAGAVPNYVLNRSWAWGLRGRPSLRREVLPYVAIVLLTLGLAIVMTGLADRIVDQLDVSDVVQTLIVGAVFLGVYAVVFVLRYFLLDRLFSRQRTQESIRYPRPHDEAG
jgi:putative flippase GtrA